ncbi:uncharacterized protein LOC135831193 [Planococcus citri]|uniref:uncharacterized protein LOC135831193 n=1 Tax=Planococcus citri TaxID=170843 RepID=UPI0031F76486
MTRFYLTLAVLWLWSSSSLMVVKCASEELEDFPLDPDESGSVNHPHIKDEFGAFDRRNSTGDLDDLSSEEENDKTGTVDHRMVTFNKIMTMAMKDASVRRSLGQVLPIIRAMSPTQRLTLATLVLKQLSPTSSLANQSPHLEQFADKSAELMLPISADIAAMLQSLKKVAESGRSTAFGTYYYNPLSAGYRVNNAQRPILYNNIRRRFQAPANNRKTANDVPPEMMPPPFVSSTNVSYATFNDKKQSLDYEDGDDNDDDDDANHVQHNQADKNVAQQANTDRGNNGDDYTSEKVASGITTAANDEDEEDDNEQCNTIVDNICNDETYSSYPSERIANSIKNLEQKHIFRALIQDFARNATVDENPEIQRRIGGSPTTPTRENTLQLCASKTKYARPKKAKSTNGSWKFIVNTDHYAQTVRIETCINADKSCSFLNENVKSYCVQIYNYHRLLTWDEKTGLSLDLFKIPTCCSCQIQQAGPSAFVQPIKDIKNPDIELQENTIVDQSNIVGLYTPLVKPKIKNKLNLSPLSTQYNMLNRESFPVTKGRRPPMPAILPLQHLDGTRYTASDNAIRRTSSKANILKGVYVPSKEILMTEQTALAKPESPSNTFPRRVNYNYHPIIDFFRSTPTLAATQAGAESAAALAADRADVDVDPAADEWLPMTEGPRAIKAH